MEMDKDELRRQAKAMARRIEEEERDAAERDLGPAIQGAQKLEALQAKLDAVVHDYEANADRTYDPEMAIMVTKMHTGRLVMKWTRGGATLIGWPEDASAIIKNDDVDDAFAATVRLLIRDRKQQAS
jgi:hypothetical protein